MNSLVSMYFVYVNDGIQTQHSHSTRVYPKYRSAARGCRLSYKYIHAHSIRITRARCVKIVENPLDKWKNHCDSFQPGLLIEKIDNGTQKSVDETAYTR